MNHDYQTPAEGTTDWHIPLNDNFTQMDTDVEIRDVDANRDQYNPKNGAKFLATDTGTIYLGDGSSWSRIGEIGTSSSSGSLDDGSIVAAPGEVQNALDNATANYEWADQRYTKVRLVSGEKYTPEGSWRVGSNTILDFNGALCKPNHSNDVLQVGDRTKIIDPYIDARSTGWGGAASMIHIDSAFAGGKITGPSNSQVYRARLIGKEGDGHGITVQDSQGAGMGGGIYVTGMVHKADRAIRVIADGGSSAFVNGVKFDMKIGHYNVGVEHSATSGAATNANWYWLDTQPLDGTSDWLWKLGTDTSRNCMWASVWDTRMYSNETVCLAESDASWNNILFDIQNFLGDWQFVNNSSHESNQIHRVSGTFQKNQ